MKEKLKEKITEAFSSVFPITAIVLILSVFVVPIDVGTISLFIVGAALLVLGMGFFSLGSDVSMMSMGEGIGIQLSKTKKLWMIIGVTFVMGVLITIAEPDLQVLAAQVPSIPATILILTVAVGVGIFLVVSFLRILFKINLSKILWILYGIVFIVSFFVPRDFLAVAFDSGGVTTGPITVPFIIAMGLGIASVRSDKNASDDSFGLLAIASVGPVLAVLLLGIFYNPSVTEHATMVIPHVATTKDVLSHFATALPLYIEEVLLAFVPIIAVFLIFQLTTKRYKKRQLIRMAVGFVYTFLGLVLFLTGVNVGFIYVGHLLGHEIAALSYNWILVPLGAVIGYFIVSAEPAVHVLNKQVEEVSDGAIPQSAMKLCLSLGVAVSVALSMIRVLTGISIYWFLIPGYLIALVLTFFVPKIFVGIAFDSGGVASGPMTSTFLLPLAMGACQAVGGSIMVDAFGAVAMVAMTPLIAIQIMGLVYAIKLKKSKPLDMEVVDLALDVTDEIIDFEEESSE